MRLGRRDHPLWWAHLAHRLSGIGLALFLPLHFLMLSQAIRGEAALDSALALTENPLVKLAEFGLVFLLAIHFFGGLRLLALEWTPWTGGQKTLAAGAAALSLLLSGIFFLQVI